MHYLDSNKICHFDHKQCIILGAIFSTIEHLVGSNLWLDFVFQKNERFSIEKENNKAFSVNILTRIPSGESIWGSRSKKDRLLKNQ
jgi:hypothetical protein